jgi:hypothetical protein
MLDLAFNEQSSDDLKNTLGMWKLENVKIYEGNKMKPSTAKVRIKNLRNGMYLCVKKLHNDY